MDSIREEPGRRLNRADQLELGLQSLFGMLLSEESLDDTLHRVAELAVAALPTCDMADVTLVRNGRPLTRGATDSRAQQFDEVQFRTGDGPCLRAWRTNRVTHLESTPRDTRWPELAEVGRSAGILSVMAVPLSIGDVAIGALNLYSTREDAFDADDGTIGHVFADQAAVALHNAQTHADAVTQAEQLRDALVSRERIEQAKGVLVAWHRCTPDEAFELLVERSQHENRKLRLVAADVVAAAQQGSAGE